MHDGSIVRFRRIDGDYDPTDTDRAYSYLRDRARLGEVVTGLLYVSPDSQDLHDNNKTVARPLMDMPYEELVPGAEKLAKLQKRYR